MGCKKDGLIMENFIVVGCAAICHDVSWKMLLEKWLNLHFYDETT